MLSYVVVIGPTKCLDVAWVSKCLFSVSMNF